MDASFMALRHHRAKTGKLYAKAETIAGQRFQNKNKLVG
jgi:hypothetical protein